MKNFIKGILTDHLGSPSSKRILAVLFAIASIVLVFVYPAHANFDFALGSMLGFAGTALGFTSYEKINTTKIDGNQERTQ